MRYRRRVWVLAMTSPGARSARERPEWTLETVGNRVVAEDACVDMSGSFGTQVTNRSVQHNKRAADPVNFVVRPRRLCHRGSGLDA